jgi:hypothetical protein
MEHQKLWIRWRRISVHPLFLSEVVESAKRPHTLHELKALNMGIAGLEPRQLASTVGIEPTATYDHGNEGVEFLVDAEVKFLVDAEVEFLVDAEVKFFIDAEVEFLIDEEVEFLVDAEVEFLGDVGLEFLGDVGLKFLVDEEVEFLGDGGDKDHVGGVEGHDG